MQKELITQQRLENDIILSLYDRSRKLIGDRWLVKIECEAVLPVREELLAEWRENCPELLHAARQNLGETVSFSVFKERNFIEESEVDAARGELIAQVNENMAGYLKNPAFPEKLFASRYAQAKKICSLERQIKQAQERDDDDGPADFSACFKD